jgi:hypothetical protein
MKIAAPGLWIFLFFRTGEEAQCEHLPRLEIVGVLMSVTKLAAFCAAEITHGG